MHESIMVIRKAYCDIWSINTNITHNFKSYYTEEESSIYSTFPL